MIDQYLIFDVVEQCGRDAANVFMAACILGEGKPMPFAQVAFSLQMNYQEIKSHIASLDEAGFVVRERKSVPIAKIGSDVTVMGSVETVCPVGINYVARLSADSWGILRSEVFERDDYTCRYCGDRGVTLECDHVVPISKGGTNELGNLVTACAPCNRSKRDKALEEWAGRSVES